MINDLLENWQKQRIEEVKRARVAKEYSKRIFSTNKPDDPSLSGVNWNSYIAFFTDPFKHRDLETRLIFLARIRAVFKVSKKESIFGLFNYFAKNWPHLCRKEWCKEKCKGKCLAKQEIKCKTHLLLVIKKLCFPSANGFFLSDDLGIVSHSHSLSPVKYIISTERTAVEKKFASCVFHADKEMVLKLKHSKKPICALCRSRSIAVISEAVNTTGEELEKRVIVYLKKQAQKEKK